MWDWFPAADPDFILSVITCDEWGNWSDGGYCNHAYDKLYAEQKTAVDPQDRQPIIFKMQSDRLQRPALHHPDLRQAAGRLVAALAGFVESTQGIFNNFSTQSLLSAHQA